MMALNWSGANGDGKLLIRDNYGDIDDSTSESDSLGNSNYTPTIISAAVCLLNIILLGIVLHLLLKLRRNHGQTVGVLLSLQVCSIEVCIALLSMVAIILSTITIDGCATSETIFRFVVNSIALLFSVSLYFVKLFLLLAALLKVYLGLSYQRFWTKEKSNCTVYFVWGFSVSLFIFVLTASELWSFSICNLYRYVIVPGAAVFMIFSTISNGYLTIMLNRSRVAPHERPSRSVQEVNVQHQQRQSFCEVLLKSQFMVPILISSVYALFLTSACIESFLRPQESFRMNVLTFLLFHTMIMIDALIFIFLEPQVRTIIRNRLRIWRAKREVASEGDSRTTASNTNDSNVTHASVEVSYDARKQTIHAS